MPEPYALDLAAVRAFCDRNGVPYVTNDELGQIAIPRPDRPAWAVRIVPRPERGMLTVAYPLPGRIPRIVCLRCKRRRGCSTRARSWARGS